jgi:DNA-binding transcriptional LysR family regulator
MDRYGELVAFVRSAAEGNFSAAARSLSLTPSAVSKLMSRLENRLGVRLFSRTGQRVALTTEGEVFYTAAIRAVDAVTEADLAVAQGPLHGEILRIRCIPSFATSQLAPMLPIFQKQHPSLRLEVNLRMEAGRFLDGGMDVAIYAGNLLDSSLVARRVASGSWLICASPEYLAAHGTPRTPADLANHKCLNLVSISSTADWRIPSGSKVRQTKVSASVVSNQGQMLLELARVGAGIARLADFHVVEDLAQGKLVDLFPDHPSSDELPVYAIYHGRRFLSLRLRAFLDFLDASFGGPMPPWRAGRSSDKAEFSPTTAS